MTGTERNTRNTFVGCDGGDVGHVSGPSIKNAPSAPIGTFHHAIPDPERVYGPSPIATLYAVHGGDGGDGGYLSYYVGKMSEMTIYRVRPKQAHHRNHHHQTPPAGQKGGSSLAYPLAGNRDRDISLGRRQCA